MSGKRVKGICRWDLDNVLVAGRRCSGSAYGRTSAEAVRRFAAVQARELGADVAAAIATAQRDPHKRVEVAVRTS